MSRTLRPLQLTYRASRADSLRNVAYALLSGADGWMFDGEDALGQIGFSRIQPLYLRLETKLFDNCVDNEPADGPKSARLTTGRVSRSWFGRLDLYGDISRDFTRVELDHDPEPKTDADGNVLYQHDAEGKPILGDDGNPLPQTKNGLTKADLKASGYTWRVGGRLSVYDGPRLHVNVFGHLARGLGANHAEANTIVVHALNADLDVTRLQSLATLSYDLNETSVGTTVGVSVRPSWLSNGRLTPFLSLGYAWISANVSMRLHPDLNDAITALGADPKAFTEPRTLDKSSLIGIFGGRFDLNDRISNHAAITYIRTERTTLYLFTARIEVRFDFPWKW